MNAALPPGLLKQHLIDPEICIRCNTCEETCPIDAITHDDTNYVVDASICNHCMACVPPCPTGAIDNWLNVVAGQAYSLEEQFSWDALPPEPPPAVSEPAPSYVPEVDEDDTIVPADAPVSSGITTAHVPPWSAAHPYINLYTQQQPIIATVVGNYRVTGNDTESDIRHIVLDFGEQPFPVLEGQSIAVIPPGLASNGRPHHARQYSIASPRDGERPAYNNLALTVKRVTADYDGRPIQGVCSNYLCDLQKNDRVSIIGPFGDRFLMPNHPDANLLMICTGTGSAPMRAMTERCRRMAEKGRFNGKLMLFFGARTQRELPYFGPLMNLPKEFIDINLALSREPEQPKLYVQDLMQQRAADVAGLLADPHTYIYVCGLKGMEAGVFAALKDIVETSGGQWSAMHAELCQHGRLHVETY